MKVLNQLLLGNEKHIGQRNMIWNMVGSGVYSLTSMLIGMAVARILGADSGGIFLFAFTTFGQQMYTVAYFGMRPVHITDVQKEYSFGDYRRFRIMTSSAAMIIGVLYTVFVAQDFLKKAVVMLMVCYKVIDGFADVYESEFQRNGKLYLTGKSNTFRTLLSVLSFLLVLVLTKDLILSSIVAVAAQLLGFHLFNQSVIKELVGIDWSVGKNTGKELYHAGKWLFLSTFLDLYIFAASKFAIDAQMEASASTYFGAVFIPTSIINLAAGFIIRPFLTSMSGYWEIQDDKKFWKSIRTIMYAILGFTAAGLAAAYFFGIPVLSLMYGSVVGSELTPYKWALLINILGGSFYAAANLLYYVLVIMKGRKSIFVIYIIGTIAAAVLSSVFVKAYGINGGAFSYLLLMGFLASMFAVAAGIKYKKVRNTHER